MKKEENRRIKSSESTHYLSLVTDVCSRRIMDYQLSSNMSSENVVKALKMAIKKKQKNSLFIIQTEDYNIVRSSISKN